MTPSELLIAFRALPPHRRRDAMRMACSYAAGVWERYAQGGPITYTDGVVGMQHVLDMTLPARALAAVDRKLAGDHVEPDEIWTAYREPITALRDEDLDLPDDIARAYYAIYNLYGFVFKRLTPYDDGVVVIQQALAGEDMFDEWWTRTWDAWASRIQFAATPSELSEPEDRDTFEDDDGCPVTVHVDPARYEGVFSDRPPPGQHLVVRRGPNGRPTNDVAIRVPTLDVRGRTLIIEYELCDPSFDDDVAVRLIVDKLLRELSLNYYRDQADQIDLRNLTTGAHRSLPYPK